MCRAQALLALLMLTPSAATASDSIESILVTAHAPSFPAGNNHGAADALDKDALKQQQAVDIQQLLSGFDGVYASVEGGPGGVNSISVRGAEPNFTVVLIDGVAVNDPTNARGGSFDLATLSSSHVRGIELIKGANSLAYGSDALSGVLKVLTAPTVEPLPVLSLEHEWRGRGAYRRSLAVNGAYEGHRISVQGAQDDSGELWQGSERSLSEYALHYRFDIENARIQAGVRRAEFDKSAYPEQSGGPELATNDDLDISSGTDASAYLSTSVELNEHWLLAVQYTQYERDFDFYSPGIAPYNNVPENSYIADYQRRQWRLVNQFNWQNWTLGVGVDRRSEQGISEGAVVFPGIPADALGFLLGLPAAPVETGASIPVPLRLDTDYRLNRRSDGQFMELGWEGEQGVWFSAGLRQDRIDGESELVERYALGLPVSEHWQLALHYSEGFKSPSFFALGHGLVGNPDLRPERASSKELSLEGVYPAWQWNVALFDNEYRDLIDFDPDNFTNVNRNRVSGQGAELAVQWSSGRLMLGLGLSYVDTEIENVDRDLANRPEGLAHLDVSYRITDQLHWYQRLSWVDDQYATSLHTGQTQSYELESYALWDTHLRWQASEQLSVYAGVENLADTTYEEAVGFPGPRRWLRLGVSLSL